MIFGIKIFFSQLSGDYNSLQLAVSKNQHKKFQFLRAYPTFAHFNPAYADAYLIMEKIEYDAMEDFHMYE